jgi:DNA-binding response OmpR family regulator/DNA-binding CsgD family transcriptional regulator
MDKILIIEDENELREEIAEILQYEGYIVFEAKNGSEGIRIAGKEHPDLILCDILMPDMDGYEVLQRLQTNGTIITIPFIFITALNERYNFRYGMELGADDYLTKPFESHELLKAIKSRIKKYSDQEKLLKLKLKQIEKDIEHRINQLCEEVDKNQEYIKQISDQNELLDKKLKEKKTELMSDAFFALEVSNKIENLKKLVSAKLKNPKLSFEQRQLLTDLKSKINKGTILDSNLTFFLMKFQQAHPEFLARLTSLVPGLTQYEVGFISATYMGLTTNQIAILLNISDDSVRKSRHRIKMKLGLSKKVNFFDYIQSLAPGDSRGSFHTS